MPSGVTVTLPWAGSVALLKVEFAGTTRSLLATFPLTGVSTQVTAWSATAPNTVSCTVAVSHSVWFGLGRQTR